MRALGASSRGRRGRAAGRDDDRVRPLALAPVSRSTARLDAPRRRRARASRCEIGDDAAELRAPRQQLGQERLAAERDAGLVERDAVAALGRDRGAFRPAGPAAGDQHAPRPRRRADARRRRARARSRDAGCRRSDSPAGNGRCRPGCRRCRRGCRRCGPRRALFGISGSQIIARVMPHMSAWPAASTRSASCGWLMRPATNTGWPTACSHAPRSGAT